jgi:hypothetical protein
VLGGGNQSRRASRVSPDVRPPGGVFSSDEFLTVLNLAWCGGRGEVAHVGVGDHVVRTLVADGRPVLDVPFLDFFVPVHGVTPSVTGRYTPRVALGDRPAAERSSVDPLVVEPAPFIRWRSFGSWDDVVAHWKASERAIERESRRREKILTRDFGPLVYEFDDRDPDTFDTCVRWKRQQFLASGAPDPFTDPRHEQLFRGLVDAGLGRVSSLRAGDRIVAAHIGLEWDDTVHWWLPTYDEDARSASPGRLLLQWVLRLSYDRGDPAFDFLRGSTFYKWIYATDFREVVEAGRRPLRRQLELTRARTVRRFPAVADTGRRVRNTVRDTVRDKVTGRDKVSGRDDEARREAG